MGVLNKCYLLFEEPFWPQDVDWLEYVSDTSGWTEWVSFWCVAKKPVLLGFNAADRGREIERLSNEQIVASAMQTLKTVYGERIPERQVFRSLAGLPIHSPLDHSFNAVGSTPSMRKTLSAPIDDKLFFAGEASHSAYFGTAHGAYLKRDTCCERDSRNLTRHNAEQSVGRGAAGRVVPEVNVDWRRPGQRRSLN